MRVIHSSFNVTCVGASGGCVGGPACACEYGSVSVGQHAQYDGASVFDYRISAL